MLQKSMLSGDRPGVPPRRGRGSPVDFDICCIVYFRFSREGGLLGVTPEHFWLSSEGREVQTVGCVLYLDLEQAKA